MSPAFRVKAGLFFWLVALAEGFDAVREYPHL